MTFVAATVKRTGVTNIATSINATITGDGVTPIDGNDIVGGLSTKNVPFAANVTADQIVSWEVVGDSANEPDEGFKVTLSDPSAPGGTISVPVARGTIMNDDNTAPAAIFPTASTADTGFISAGSVDEWVLTTTVDNTDWEIFLGCDDNDGSPGASVKRVAGDRITAFTRDASAVEGQNNQMLYQQTPGFTGGVSLVFKYKRSTGKATITIADTVVRTDVSLTAANGGPFLRFRTGAAARPAVTVTAA